MKGRKMRRTTKRRFRVGDEVIIYPTIKSLRTTGKIVKNVSGNEGWYTVRQQKVSSKVGRRKYLGKRKYFAPFEIKLLGRRSRAVRRRKKKR